MNTNKNIVITSAVRTAIGSFRGSLKDMQAKDLGASVVKSAMKKSNLDSKDIDELIMGQVLTAATGQNSSRYTERKNCIYNKSSLWIGTKISRSRISSNYV